MEKTKYIPYILLLQKPAVTCLSSILESLEADSYTDLYDIVLPYISIDKHEDEDVSSQQLINMREVGFQAIGKAWPKQEATTTHSKSTRA